MLPRRRCGKEGREGPGGVESSSAAAAPTHSAGVLLDKVVCDSPVYVCQ